MSAVIVHLTLKKKPSKPRKRKVAKREPTKTELLNQLRAESRARAGTRYSLHEDTPLVELAYFASHARGRSVHWRGIKFPIRYSLYRDVLDPETFEPLISALGGVLF